MTDLINALLHAVAYALVGGAMLVVAYYVLDLATPGHLGTHLRGVDENGNESVHAHSKGAGVVTSAWLVSNAAVLFTAIWTNGETSLGWALGWTVCFGALGIALNTLMFFAVEAIAPSPTSRPPSPSRSAPSCAPASPERDGVRACGGTGRGRVRAGATPSSSRDWSSRSRRCPTAPSSPTGTRTPGTR